MAYEKIIEAAQNSSEGLAKIAGSIVGSKARKREEAEAKQENAERLYDYENFDYNQDVGFINDPYAQLAAKQQDYYQDQGAAAQANAARFAQQSGQFGGATAIVQAGAEQTNAAAQKLETLRAKGAEYVDSIRQDRISTEYSKTQTLLGRSDKRLAAAKKARADATKQLVEGIGQTLSGNKPGEEEDE